MYYKYRVVIILNFDKKGMFYLLKSADSTDWKQPLKLKDEISLMDLDRTFNEQLESCAK